ncbi:MAG: hypothetical protein MUP45_01205 [Candidatus Marinimicrobia bacterium]|nr:hypothetical protein [Candidatus Neomarinimicrobiota bacterium]
MPEVGQVKMEMRRFNNKRLVSNGKITLWGTVFYVTAGQQENRDSSQMLYSDAFLPYRWTECRVEPASDILLILERIPRGLMHHPVAGSDIHVVNDFSNFRVTADGLLGRLVHGRLSIEDKQELPHVRKAIRGIKPSFFSDRDFLQVDTKLKGKVLFVLEFGHPRLPEYRVFDTHGQLISFRQLFPLSSHLWE